MFIKKMLERQNRIHVKILLTFLCLIFTFAIAEILMSNRRVSRNIEARTTKLLQNHILLLDEVIKEQEEKVAFYAQFMADIMKLSDQLTDTTAGRSAPIYLLESLKKDRIKIHLYRQLPQDERREGLIKKGLLGIRTTSLVEASAHGKPLLSIAAVAPIERAGGIREVIIAEFPLDYQFLKTLKRKTGANITLIYGDRVFSSALSPTLQERAFGDIFNKELRREVLQRGRRVAKEISDENDPQKIVFSPLAINFKNQGVYAVSLSLKEVLVNKRTILLQNIVIVVAILGGVVALYYFIVRRLTHPIMELSSASKKIAEGNLEVIIDVKTKDEIGQLGEGFNRMVGQLRQSQDKVKRQMDELSQLYKEVSEERNISKSILDNLTNGVILFDADQRAVLINPTAQQWLGLKEERVKGMQIIGDAEDPSLEPLYQLAGIQPTKEMIRCWKYFSCEKEKCSAHGNHDLRCWFISGTYCRDEIAKEYPQKREGCRKCAVYEAYSSALKRQEQVRVEEVELTGPGPPQHRILKVSLCPIFDDHGKFLGVITVLNDITAEREIDRLKTEFVSLVSHELRTPLSSIKAYAEILLKRPNRDLDQRVEFLNIINEETDRLTRLINDILNITKIEERKTDIERRPVDISGVIDKSVSAHRSSAQRKHITIDVGVQKDIPLIWGDEDSLMQVLANLLNNAVKYTSEGGEIRISAQYLREDSRLSGEVEVRVRDNGIGIPSEYLERVFERFYRIDHPHEGDETGTGLGLYFCKYIVERHSGRIWAESEVGKGSTVILKLPVAERAEILRESKMHHEPLYTAQADDLLLYPKALREKISILVVDDDKRVRDFLRYHMQEEGFTVYEAEDGFKAVDLAQKIKPSVIVLDTVMPGMDGYEVLETLKEDQATEHIPVVILSGSEDSKVAMELGATHYLVKPIARRDLIKVVGDILKETTSDGQKEATA